MELNREQIIKALECCIKAESWGDCEELGCPAHTKQGCYFYLRTDDDYENIIDIELCKDALSVIKELTEENERLKSVEFTCGFVKPHKVLECPIFDEIGRVKADTARKIIEDIATLLEANWEDIQHGSYWLTNGRCTPLRELLKTVEKKYVEEDNND